MKEKIITFIQLLIENEMRQTKFYDLLPEIELYDIIWDTENAMAKTLGISEEMMDYTIRGFLCSYFSFFKNSHVYDENENEITTIEELADFIIRDIEYIKSIKGE